MYTKGISISLGIFACFVTNIYALSVLDSTQSMPEFRNIKWGSLLIEVEEQETERYLQTFSGFGVEALSYKGNIAGLDARIDYTFKSDKFLEGSYTINSSDSFRNDFQTLLIFLENLYGRPGYSSGKHYKSDSVWTKRNDLELFRGPSYYWAFSNGFISLIAEKFKLEITITILYGYDQTIEEYNSENLIELKNFNTIRIIK
ncbi:hypothetical protein ACFLSS_02085 [Bacteroidota bacterium]